MSSFQALPIFKEIYDRLMSFEHREQVLPFDEVSSSCEVPVEGEGCEGDEFSGKFLECGCNVSSKVVRVSGEFL